jgi:Zn-dependent metalloprotease
MKRVLAAAVLLLLAAGAEAVRPGPGRRDARRYGMGSYERALRRAPRPAARRDFTRFNALNGGSWKIRFDPRTGAPAALLDGRLPARSRIPEQAARSFLAEQAPMLGVDPASLSSLKESRGAGHRHLLFGQTYRGLPVEFARVKVHLDDSGFVTGFNSTYETDLDLDVTPRVSAADASAAAAADAGGTAFGQPELVVLPLENEERPRLAWKLRVRGPAASWRYFVDAQTGAVLFRYNNLRFVCLTSGTVSGMVYDVDPSSTPGPVQRPFNNQWVYIADGSTRAITGGDAINGEGFYCAGTQGKAVMSLQGPYVNVSNYRGANAHYDNGSGAWATWPTPLSSPHPYPNASTLVSTINLTASVPLAVKFLPIFTNFHVGEFSGGDVSDAVGGDITDDDQLTITDAAGDPIASYVGNRGAFNGAAVHGKVMRLVLRSNSAGQQHGYDVSLSSYLTVTSPFTYGAPGTSSHVWLPANSPANLRGEMSLFYHLNAMRDYFFNDVNRTSAAAVSRPVHAMAHVGPNMLNAFYNPDYDNLYFGDVNTTTPQDLFTDDATVIRHEYVHYLVEKIWPIQNFGQAGAISEAIADYYAASSLNNSAIGAFVVQGLGGSGALRELDCQKPGQSCRILTSTNWAGQIHDDSIYIGQAFWDIRRDRVNALGYSAGRSCADGLIWQALLYFPESFAEFHDALRRVDADGRVTACGGAGTAQAAINTAFASHGLILGGGDNYEDNDGFQTAVDISSIGTVSATLNPSGDVDTWSFGAGSGLVRATLRLPSFGGFYKAYQLKLYDRAQRLVASAAPPYDGFDTVDGICEAFNCTTTASQVVLQYNNPSGGQLYLQVLGGDALLGSNSGVNSATPYSLSVEFPRSGALSGSIVSASFDADTISFSVDVTSFVSTQNWRFAYAQLRDHAFQAVPNSRTSVPAAPGDYLLFVSSANGAGRITGSARLAPGFAARFPALGTVHLEVFGYNVSGSTVSLGLSNPMNLTATGAQLTAYNNVFNPARGEKATIKYATTAPGRVHIRLFTVSGRYVATLLDSFQSAGKGSVDWDGRNISGSVVASGIYLIHIEAPGIRRTQKVAIVK